MILRSRNCKFTTIIHEIIWVKQNTQRKTAVVNCIDAPSYKVSVFIHEITSQVNSTFQFKVKDVLELHFCTALFFFHFTKERV